MALNVGSLYADLSLNISNFISSLKQAQDAATDASASMSESFAGAGSSSSSSGDNSASGGIKKVNNSVKALRKNFVFAGKDIRRIVQGIVVSRLFYSTMQAIQSATQSLYNFQSRMQESSVAFKYFLGNQQAAQGFIETMKDFAAVTPFTTQTALQESQKLMAMGFQPTQVKSVMQILTDTAAASGATSEQIDRIVLALGQMHAKAKLSSQELRQLAEAGIPAYKILQDQLGLTQKQMEDIGKLGITGDKAVTAILQGLQKRYKGASQEIANTNYGMMSTIKDDLLIVGEQIMKGPFGAITNIIKKIRDGLESARQIVKNGGLGALFQSIVPENIQNSFRIIAATIKETWQCVVDLIKAISPYLGMAFQYLIKIMATVNAVLIPIIRGIVNFIQWALRASPVTRALAQAIMTLLVASLAAKGITLLIAALKKLTIVTVVTKLIQGLTVAIKFLYVTLTAHPLVGIIMLVAAALVSLALSCKTVCTWLDNLGAKLAKLAGYDPSKVLQPTKSDQDLNAWMKKFSQAFKGLDSNLKDTGKDLSETGDAADKAGKKVKDKFVAAFDELFQVPDTLDDIVDDLGDLGDTDLGDLGLGDLPNLGDLYNKNKNVDETGDDNRNKIPTPLPIKFPSGGDSGGAIAGATAMLTTVTMLCAEFNEQLQQAYEKAKQWAIDTGQTVGQWATESAGKIHQWAIDTGQTVGQWATESAGKIHQWAIDTGTILTGWVAQREVEFNTWSATTLATITVWCTSTAALISSWCVNEALAFTTWCTDTTFKISVWCTNTVEKISEWCTNTNVRINDWCTNTDEAINDWITNTELNLSLWCINTEVAINDWITNTELNLSLWCTNTKVAIASWATVTNQNIRSWINATSKYIHDWCVNTATNINAWAVKTSKVVGDWCNITSANIAQWVTATSANVSSWANTVGENIGKWATAASEMIAGFATNAAEAFSSWLSVSARNLVSWIRNTLDNLWDWAAKAIAAINAVNTAQGAATARAPRRKNANTTDWSPTSWAAQNKSWLIPVGAAALVVGGIAAEILTGGAVTGAFAAALALEHGGFVTKDQLVRMGEKNRTEVVIPLQNESYMKPFADAVANDLRDSLPVEGGNSYGAYDRIPVFVYNLIADDRSLKELERKLRIIRIQEKGRRGGAE